MVRGPQFEKRCVKRTRKGAAFKELSQICEKRRLSSCPSAWKDSVPGRPVVGNLGARGQKQERIGMFAGYIITNTFFLLKTYLKLF